MRFTCAAIAAVLVLFGLTSQGVLVDFQINNNFFLYVAIFLLSTFFFAQCFSWLPISKLEAKLIPGIQSLMEEDTILKRAALGFIFFVFFFLGMSCSILSQSMQSMIMTTWLVLLGISLDLFFIWLNRLHKFLNPYFTLSEIASQAQIHWTDGRDDLVTDKIQMVVESGLIGIKKGRLSFVKCACERLEEIAKKILYNKNYAHQGDRITFFSVFLQKQFELMIEAIERATPNMDMGVEYIASICAKMLQACYRSGNSTAHIPILLLDKLAMQSLKTSENALTAIICALTETIKSCIDLSQEEQRSHKEDIIKLLRILENLVKQAYQKNKSMSIALMMQPFADCASHIAEKTGQNIPDKEEVLNVIKGVLSELNALDTILRNKQREIKPSKPEDLNPFDELPPSFNNPALQ